MDSHCYYVCGLTVLETKQEKQNKQKIIFRQSSLLFISAELIEGKPLPPTSPRAARARSTSTKGQQPRGKTCVQGLKMTFSGGVSSHHWTWQEQITIAHNPHMAPQGLLQTHSLRSGNDTEQASRQPKANSIEEVLANLRCAAD